MPRPAAAHFCAVLILTSSGRIEAGRASVRGGVLVLSTRGLLDQTTG